MANIEDINSEENFCFRKKNESFFSTEGKKTVFERETHPFLHQA